MKKHSKAVEYIQQQHVRDDCHEVTSQNGCGSVATEFFLIRQFKLSDASTDVLWTFNFPVAELAGLFHYLGRDSTLPAEILPIYEKLEACLTKDCLLISTELQEVQNVGGVGEMLQATVYGQTALGFSTTTAVHTTAPAAYNHTPPVIPCIGWSAAYGGES
jgi:hypothetical protein